MGQHLLEQVYHTRVQGPEYPHPGRTYTPHASPRVAYLPDSQDGEKAPARCAPGLEAEVTVHSGSVPHHGDQRLTE